MWVLFNIILFLFNIAVIVAQYAVLFSIALW